MIDENEFWFKQPIISVKEPLDKFLYKTGMSPNSEKIGPKIFNIPCNLNKKEFDLMYVKLSEILKRKFNN